MKSVLLTLLACLAVSPAVTAWSDEPAMAHMVFFTLADKSDANRDQLVAGCQKYLSGHEGVLHFSVGVNHKDFDRDVNDKSFDVSLHLVFKNSAAHDVYHDHPRHLEFIDKHKQLWSKVVVFDSYVKDKSSESK